MQIMRVDNFGRDYIDEHVVAKDIGNKEYADVMVAALNTKFGGEHSLDFFRVVEDGVPPFKFTP